MKWGTNFGRLTRLRTPASLRAAWPQLVTRRGTIPFPQVIR